MPVQYRLARLPLWGGGAAILLFCMAENAFCGFHHGVAWFSEAPNDGVRTTAAQRYEVGVSGLASGEDRLAVKEMNPAFRWFVYNSISDNYVPPHPGDTEEHELLITMAAQRGWDVEEAYIHYWNDTYVTLGTETHFIPGWGGGSSTDPALSRVPIFNSELTRRACNFSTGRARRLFKESSIAMLLDVPFPGTSLYADGIFFDNSSGRLFNRGTIVSGGLIREMPNHDHVDSQAFRNWYFDSVTQFLGEFKDTLETSAGWSKDGRRKEVMCNIANAWDDNYVTRDVADILFLEFLYNPVRDWGVDWIDEAHRRDALASAAGITSFYSATMTRSVAGHEGVYDYDDTLLGNFAWYLMTRTPTTLFYQQGTNLPATAGWDTLTWRGVMDVAEQNLGEAVGPPYTLISGTDPLGNPYKIKARNYDRGLVVIRNRGSWSEGIEPTTAVEVNLPELLTPLSPDGSPLTPIDRITLRNGQGGIFVRGQVPVTLLAFSAERSGNGAWIRWETGEESPGFPGFHVYRDAGDGSRTRLTDALVTGNRTYAWFDPDPPAGAARYWLSELSRTGETIWYGPTLLQAEGTEPGLVALAQNRPNPFRGSTAIRFSAEEDGLHSLIVYDASGREVVRLFEGTLSPGDHELIWNGLDAGGRRAAPGVYVYSLRTPTRSLSRKLLLAP